MSVSPGPSWKHPELQAILGPYLAQRDVEREVCDCPFISAWSASMPSRDRRMISVMDESD
jgi:hypothetical protein